MIELFGWIAAVLAVAGVILNNRRMIACFWLWMVSNILSGWIHCDAAVHHTDAMWPLLWRDGIFLLFAIEGWLLWRKPKTKTNGYRWRKPRQAR